MSAKNQEEIDCPYCGQNDYAHWATDNGFTAVKCNKCSFVYVNPRPLLSLIDDAVKTGTHSAEANSKNVVSRRVASHVAHYRKILRNVFADIWAKNESISWLDVGAGYGEFLEAVDSLAAKGSVIEGLEPMGPKAVHAIANGFRIHQKFITDCHDKFSFISIVNVFSHVPDFRTFLKDIRKCLNEGGELFIETGDTACFRRNQIPGEIDLPDHLVFGSEKHLRGFLEECGFQVLSVQKVKIDTIVNFAKDIIKVLIGRPVILSLPYSSPYTTMYIRAKLANNG